MIDFLTPDAKAQLRAFLLDVGIEAATRAIHTEIGNTQEQPIRVPPDISTAPAQPSTDAPTSTTSATATDTVAAQPTGDTTAQAPVNTPATAAGVANLPVALVPADHAYFERSLWCDMRVRSTLPDANQVVDEFNARFPSTNNI
jgi:hypothetical protein